jgi:hypothetical protein
MCSRIIEAGILGMGLQSVFVRHPGGNISIVISFVFRDLFFFALFFFGM